MIIVLGELFPARAAPAGIRSDNGRKFVADTLMAFLADHEVTAAFIEKASPQRKC